MANKKATKLDVVKALAKEFNGSEDGMYYYVNRKQLAKGVLFNPDMQAINSLHKDDEQVTEQEWDAFETKGMLAEKSKRKTLH